MFESSVFDSKDIKEVAFDVQCLQVSTPEQKFIVFLIKIWALNLTRTGDRNDLLSVVVSNESNSVEWDETANKPNNYDPEVGFNFLYTIYFTIKESYTYQMQQSWATALFRSTHLNTRFIVSNVTEFF